MGVDKIPDYFPVGYKKDGTAKGDYYTLENFRNLSRLIDKKIINMGNSLHNGRVSPVPVGKDGEGKMCKYCAYKSICGYEYGDETVEITSLTHGKAIERLEGNENE
jgi:ATP-dependent helicase/DNAse subunit B